MSDDVLAFHQQNLRATDSNSLLRLYDEAQAILSTSPLQLQRARADKAIRRIAQELQIAPETVKSHVKRIFIKLAVQSRAHAVSTASVLGLL